MGDELSQLVDAPSPGPGDVPMSRSGAVALSPSIEIDERDARRSLREQIARLERDLANAFVTTFEMGGQVAPEPPPRGVREPRLLDLGELEVIRDTLTARLRDARLTITATADEQERRRVLLERMLLEPGRYRFARVSCRDLGEPGCGVWQVRPRLGLIGMLMGWWQVKLSSGCPLAGGRDRARCPTRP